jgi:hypothetical protein
MNAYMNKYAYKYTYICICDSLIIGKFESLLSKKWAQQRFDMFR